jgi:hypothetical protein
VRELGHAAAEPVRKPPVPVAKSRIVARTSTSRVMAASMAMVDARPASTSLSILAVDLFGAALVLEESSVTS